MIALESGFLIPLFCILAVMVFYPPLIIYLCIIANAGVFTWLILGAMLSPIVALWYYVVRKRMLSYMKVLLESKPYAWDVEKTLAEYEELLKKKRED